MAAFKMFKALEVIQTARIFGVHHELSRARSSMTFETLKALTAASSQYSLRALQSTVRASLICCLPLHVSFLKGGNSMTVLLVAEFSVKRVINTWLENAISNNFFGKYDKNALTMLRVVIFS